MNEIGVNPQTLNLQTDSIQRNLTLLRRDMDKMYDAVKALDAMWDGPASEVFKIQFEQDRGAMGQMCDTIQSIVNSMRYAKGEYDTCESCIDSIISSIRVYYAAGGGGRF